VRCVGSAAEAAVGECFRPARAAAVLPAVGAIIYGHVLDADGRPLDEVLLARVAADVFEVNCHGGPAAVRAVGARLAALGLEPVDADALLEREGATRLERDARRALRRATTPLAARVLLDQSAGALAAALAAARADLDAGRPAEAAARLGRLAASWAGCGRFLADPPRVVLAGRPNVGKSTLLNHLVAADRVLTAPTPGTTRDAVEVEAALEGAPVVLVDTAGLRDAGDLVEREGVARATQEARRAALVVYLLDASSGRRPQDDAALARLGAPPLVVWNKVDAAPVGSGPPPGETAVSALTGAGVAALAPAILDRLGWCPPDPGQAVPFTAEQAEAVAAAREALGAGRPEAARARLAALL